MISEDAQELLDYLRALVLDVKINNAVPEKLADNDEFVELDAIVRTIRESAKELGVGNLSYDIQGKGFILGSMKNLQASLRNLTWKTKAIASGDFSQSVDFLGEFSDAFNSMTRKLEHSIQEIKALSITDKLTQIYNRLKLDESLEKEWERSNRTEIPFSLMILDIDHFKSVNDTFGHQVGDIVLIELADILRTHVRSIDIVGRWGGEEFLIILPETDQDGAILLAEKLRVLIDEKNFTRAGKITASFGVAAYHNDRSPELIVSRADSALYKAKENGRNRVEFLSVHQLNAPVDASQKTK